MKKLRLRSPTMPSELAAQNLVRLAKQSAKGPAKANQVISPKLVEAKPKNKIDKYFPIGSSALVGQKSAQNHRSRSTKDLKDSL